MEPRISVVTLGTTDLGRARRFYEAMGWQPAWTPERITALSRAIGEADRHGLDPAHYLDGVGAVADPQYADMRLTASALRYARVLSEGTVDPTSVEELWSMEQNRVRSVPATRIRVCPT